MRYFDFMNMGREFFIFTKAYENNSVKIKIKHIKEKYIQGA